MQPHSRVRVLPSDAAAPAEDGGPPAGDGDRYLSIGDDAQDRDQRCRAWLQEPRASLTLTLNPTLHRSHTHPSPTSPPSPTAYPPPHTYGAAPSRSLHPTAPPDPRSSSPRRASPTARPHPDAHPHRARYHPTDASPTLSAARPLAQWAKRRSIIATVPDHDTPSLHLLYAWFTLCDTCPGLCSSPGGRHPL